jgi:hypothetical protein
MYVDVVMFLSVAKPRKLCSQLITQLFGYTNRNHAKKYKNFIEIHVFDYTTSN